MSKPCSLLVINKFYDILLLTTANHHAYINTPPNIMWQNWKSYINNFNGKFNIAFMKIIMINITELRMF